MYILVFFGFIMVSIFFMCIIMIEDPIIMSIDNPNVVGINYCPNLFSVLLRTYLVALIVTSIYTYLLFSEIGPSCSDHN